MVTKTESRPHCLPPLVVVQKNLAAAAEKHCFSKCLKLC